MGAHVAEYLRARRALVTPKDVGLPEGTTRRRVAGLRREELSQIAGVSFEYYVRLEQGRDIQPSHQVLRSLARALRLDEDALHHLARLSRLDAGEATSPFTSDQRVVPSAVGAMISALRDTPAVVLDSNQDVHAWNDAAAALTAIDVRPGTNLALSLFDPVFPRSNDVWVKTVRWSLAALRYHGDPRDLRFRRVLESLQQADCETFRRVWGRHDAQPFNSLTVQQWHPDAGGRELQLQGIEVGGAPGLYIILGRGLPDVVRDAGELPSRWTATTDFSGDLASGF
jgi:transcriptional regulator with XRE-family HTH domain